MSKEFKSKKFSGVYYRELEGKDRSYFLRIRIDGKVKRFPIGKKSEGITEAFCNQEKARILNSHRFGEDVAMAIQKVKKDDPTFSDLVDTYLKRNNLRPNTVKCMQIMHRVPFANAKKVTQADVQAYIDDMRVKYRPETVILRYRQVRSVMAYAIDKSLYKHADPTKGIDLPKKTGPRQRYLTPEEIQRLLDAVVDDMRIYLFVKMCLCTGARLNTLLSVHSRDIRPDGSVQLYNHKSSRWYEGYFDEETMDILKGKEGYVLARPGQEDSIPKPKSIQFKLLYRMNKLFNNENTPVEMRAVIHSLRHSVAVRMLDKGVPMEVISKTLDHSGIAITANVYAKVTPTLVEKSVRNLWD